VKKVSLIFLFFIGKVLLADELQVVPSATEISTQENLSIDFRVNVDGQEAEIGRIDYNAPDFDLVNTYENSSQGFQTIYSNGQLKIKRTLTTTVVLHPKKEGKFKITNISVTVNGKKLTAPDLVIEVSNQVITSNQSQSFNSRRNTMLPGSGIMPSQKDSGNFFIRTEPDKLKVYKGEQIILTYALYTQTKILGIQVERYPSVPGFLKEDIDIPLLRNQLQYSKSVVNGKEYARAVLAQYAVFPLKEGKLTIDPLTGKFTYYNKNLPSLSDDDDVFGVLNNFISSMRTSVTTKSSNPVTIEVMPLPAANQPQNFSGLVGDFYVSVSVDKNKTKIGEAINFQVKIEGEGHAGSIESLNVNFPQEFELYESKSQTTFHKTGRSEKVFEYLLIPRKSGKFIIPEVSISMFVPKALKYLERKSEQVTIEVEGSSNSITQNNNNNTFSNSNLKDTEKNLFKKPEEILGVLNSKNINSTFFIKLFEKIGLILGIIVLILIFYFLTPKNKKQKHKIKTKADYERLLQKSIRQSSNIKDSLKQIKLLLLDLLKEKLNLEASSLTQEDLINKLKEYNLKEEVISAIVFVFEQVENLRYSPVDVQSDELKNISKKFLEILNSIDERKILEIKEE
jgi:hypothetical protein